jgi:hypothetical protein
MLINCIVFIIFSSPGSGERKTQFLKKNQQYLYIVDINDFIVPKKKNFYQT